MMMHSPLKKSIFVFEACGAVLKLIEQEPIDLLNSIYKSAQ